MSASRPEGPELRIGDAEREAAATALGEHYAAGRLTKEEYDERAEQVYAARTRSALYPLFADLPRPERGPSSSEQTAPGPRRPGPDRGPRWRGGLMPVLVIVIALAVLTHLPVILLVLVAWVLAAKVFHLWGYSHGRSSWHQHDPHSRHHR